MVYKNKLDNNEYLTDLLGSIEGFRIPSYYKGKGTNPDLSNFDSIILLLVNLFDYEYVINNYATIQEGEKFYKNYFGEDFRKKLKDGTKPRFIRYFLNSYTPANQNQEFFLLMDDAKRILIEWGWIDENNSVFKIQHSRQKVNVYLEKLVNNNLIVKRGNGYFHSDFSYYNPDDYFKLKKTIHKSKLKQSLTNGPITIIYQTDRRRIVKMKKDRDLEGEIVNITREASVKIFRAILNHHKREGQTIQEVFKKSKDARNSMPIIITDFNYDYFCLMDADFMEPILGYRLEKPL